MRGDGSIALILDIPSFFQKVRRYRHESGCCVLCKKLIRVGVEPDLSEYMGAYIDGSRKIMTQWTRCCSVLSRIRHLEAVEEIFRAAHTLKACHTMGLKKLRTRLMRWRIFSTSFAVVRYLYHCVIDVIIETFDVLRTLLTTALSQQIQTLTCPELSSS
jgi:chemotaxis protein histidine kinase CheA